MKSLWRLLQWVWKALNFVRNLVMNIFFLFFIVFIMAVFSLLDSHKTGTELTGYQGALLLELDGYLADNRDENMDWLATLGKLNGERVPLQISTFDVVYAISKAQFDDRIRGLVLDLNFFEGADLPALDYVGKAISAFKTADKPVIAYADNYNQAQYYLASFADEVYLNPAGQVDIHGLSAQNLYFKSMLDKLEVTPHVFRVGTYKAAVEPILRDDMSPEAKRNTSRWLNQMWENYRDGVAQNRNIFKDRVLPAPKDYLTGLKAAGGDGTKYTLWRGLVNQLASSSQIAEKLTVLFGKGDDDDFKHVDFNTYLAALPDRLEAMSADYNIAVVNVEGTIINGESDEENAGGDTIVRLLRQAQDDDDIKGVILRVNSPGGSAFAAEKIRQETEQLQKMGKPVVVSMGGMAASGGYWISGTADYIVADKNTLTGSIGIFAVLPTFEKSLKKIGVNTDGVTTSVFAQGNGLQSLPKELNERYQLEIGHGYDAFLDVVSRGRHLTKAQVDQIAQGQVWLGQDALQHKLVDALGDIHLAMDKASELALAKMPDDSKNVEFGMIWLVDEPKGLNAFFKSVKNEAKSRLQLNIAQMLGLPAEINRVHKQPGLFNSLNDPKGQYLYCLNCAVVK